MVSDLVERDPLAKKKPWSWLSSEDVFSLPLPTGLKKMDFRAPAINVVDSGKEIRISAELPGVDKKGLKVTLSDSSVSINASASSKQSKRDSMHSVVYSEFSSQSFFRSVPLPDVVNPKKASVSFKNGLLEITAPKADAFK